MQKGALAGWQGEEGGKGRRAAQEGGWKGGLFGGGCGVELFLKFLCHLLHPSQRSGHAHPTLPHPTLPHPAMPHPMPHPAMPHPTIGVLLCLQGNCTHPSIPQASTSLAVPSLGSAASFWYLVSPAYLAWVRARVAL